MRIQKKKKTSRYLNYITRTWFNWTNIQWDMISSPRPRSGKKFIKKTSMSWATLMLSRNTWRRSWKVISWMRSTGSTITWKTVKIKSTFTRISYRFLKCYARKKNSLLPRLRTISEIWHKRSGNLRNVKG